MVSDGFLMVSDGFIYSKFTSTAAAIGTIQQPKQPEDPDLLAEVLPHLPKPLYWAWDSAVSFAHHMGHKQNHITSPKKIE